MDSPTLSLPDLLRFYFERGDAMQRLWTVYAVVALAALAYFARSRRQRPRLVGGLLLIAAFAGFAFFNLTALRDVAEQRQRLYQLIRPQSQPGLAQPALLHGRNNLATITFFASLDNVKPKETTVRHLVADGITIGMLLFLLLEVPANRRRNVD